MRGRPDGIGEDIEPANWISSEAWPIMVTRRPSPSTRDHPGLCRREGAWLALFGQGNPAAELPAHQLSETKRGPSPSGLKKKVAVRNDRFRGPW